MQENTKIFIIDFEDSFTYNIANVIYPYCNQIEIINTKDFFELYFNNIILKEKIAIIFGPGPGHPNQYQQYFPQIKILLKCKNIYLMGICLGHQIIAKQIGHQIVASEKPCHGELVSITWKKKIFNVQRYNSLAVKPKNKNKEILLDNEVMILNYENGQSFQFHPESVGTEKSAYFFNDLLSFVEKS